MGIIIADSPKLTKAIGISVILFTSVSDHLMKMLC